VWSPSGCVISYTTVDIVQSANRKVKVKTETEIERMLWFLYIVPSVSFEVVRCANKIRQTSPLPPV
jgi:hypothetical protein